MALPQPPGEIAHDGVRLVTRDANEIGPQMLRVLRGGVAYAGEIQAAGEDVAARNAAVSAAEALLDSSLLTALAAALGMIYLAYYIHEVMRHLLGYVPFVGGKLQSLWDFVFNWLAPSAGWVAETMNSTAERALHGFVVAVQWAAQQAHGLAQNPLDVTIESYVRPVKTEVDHLWGWVNDINTWVDHISKYVYGHLTPAEAVQGPLAPQVHDLQRKVAAIEQAQVIQEGQLVALSGQIAQLYAEWTDLLAHVTGVRAVNVGVQDLYTQVENLTTEVHQLQTVTMSQVVTHTGQIAALYPLGILLDAGEQGLKNLRKLEDDPCQCPRLPGVINELGLAMAVLHHVKGD